MELMSVVTPAFQASSFIARPGRSLLQQTDRDWEWIVVSDDGANYEKILAEQ